MNMPSSRFSGAVLGALMEEYETPSECRPVVTTIISTLRRLGLPDLHEASAELLRRIADGPLASLRDLERLARLLENARLSEAAAFLFLDRELTLDGLDAMIRSREITDSATLLVSNLELRLDADVPLKPEERRDLARLKRFLDEALPGVTVDSKDGSKGSDTAAVA